MRNKTGGLGIIIHAHPEYEHVLGRFVTCVEYKKWNVTNSPVPFFAWSTDPALPSGRNTTLVFPDEYIMPIDPEETKNEEVVLGKELVE